MSRQHEIQDNEIGSFLACGAERVGPGARRRDAVTLFREVVGDERRNVGLVVHHENTVGRARTGLIRHEQAERDGSERPVRNFERTMTLLSILLALQAPSHPPRTPAPDTALHLIGATTEHYG